MSFDKTKSGISYLEQRGSVTSYDIFNLFHNLCDDAEAFGHGKLEKIPCRSTSEDDLVATFLWCSKKIVRVITKNKETISDSYYREKVDDQITRLNESIEFLENQMNQVKEDGEAKVKLIKAEEAKKRQLLDTEKAVAALLSEQEQKLKAAKAELEEQIREKEQLASECDRLQAFIDSCQNIDFPALRIKKQTLLEEKKKMEEEKTALSAEIHDIGIKIAGAQKKKSSLESDRDLQEHSLRGVKQECDKLNHDIMDIKTQKEELEVDVKDKEAEYQIEKAGIDRLDGKRKNLIEMIQKLREDQSNFNLDILTVRKEKEQMEYERKKREYDAEQRKLDETYKAYQIEYQQLGAELEEQKKKNLEMIEKQKAAIDRKKTDDQAQIQSQLAAVEARKAAAINEIRYQTAGIAEAETAAANEIQAQRIAMQNRMKEKEERIAREKEKQQELERQLEHQKAEFAREQQVTEEKIRSVNAEIDRLKKSRKTLNTELIEASQKQKELEEWFRGNVAAANQSSLAELRNQITVLQAAKQNLDREFEKRYIMDGDNENVKLDVYREYFENTLIQVENELDEYSKKYAIVLEAIGKGGNQS